jgi:hypothetical protein
MTFDPVLETQLLRLSDLRTKAELDGFTIADARRVIEADPRDLIDDMVARGRLRATGSGTFVKVRPAPPPSEPRLEQVREAPVFVAPRGQMGLFGGGQ